ncbi:MAG: hypothetical protein NTX63_05445 [Candidatus Peregrinibacteria bacterium]|nr:hypothetical protein [Candidatus Peregrinibacteria bacterium]
MFVIDFSDIKTILSPSRAPTKLHKIADLRDDPDGPTDVAIQTRLQVIIAKNFDTKRLDMYQNMLTCPQSVLGWMTIYDEVAQELFGKSLFTVQAYQAPAPQHEVTHSVFANHYASGLPQSPAIAFAVSYFFDYLVKRYNQSVD